MSEEVRPDVSKPKLGALGALLVIGLGSLWGVGSFFDPETFVLSGLTPGAPLGAMATQVALTKTSTVYGVIAAGLSSSLVIVTLYELIKLFVQYSVWWTTKRPKIEKFFGKGASERPEDAEIIAQTDPLRKMLRGLVDDSDAALERAPHHRLYKARHWVNRYDVEAGRAILKLFRKAGLAAPQLKPVDEDRDQKPETAPFKMLLGLGFTKEAELLRRQFAGWLRVEMTPIGDALSIRTSLLPGNWQSRLVGVPGSDPEFTTLHPRNWSVQRWLESPESSRDYGVIVRHASDTGSGSGACVYFWIGGFTDRGTAAAGRYLAEHWEDLNKRFVERRDAANPYGDFLIVIEGASQDKDRKKNAAWTLVADFVVQPADVATKAEMKWSSK